MDESVEQIKASRDHWYRAYEATEIYACKIFRICCIEALVIVFLLSLLIFGLLHP